MPRACRVHWERFLSAMCSDDPGKGASAGCSQAGGSRKLLSAAEKMSCLHRTDCREDGSRVLGSDLGPTTWPRGGPLENMWWRFRGKMRLRCFAGCLTSSWPPSYPGEEVGVPCPSGPPSCSLLEAQAGGRPTLEREASLRGWRGLICLEGETPGPAGCSRAPTYPGALRGFRTS